LSYTRKWFTHNAKK